MRWILSMMIALALLWGGAFILFLSTMLMPPQSPHLRTDALVVLTGGNGRVERGLELFAQGKAPVLIISGVGQKARLWEVLQTHASPVLLLKIAQKQAQGGEILLDHAALTTQTNASEVAEILEQRSIHSLRLITAHYHMPRSLLEFHHALPDATILAEPIRSENFASSHWWENLTARRLVVQEFHKYWLARLRIFIASSADASK